MREAALRALDAAGGFGLAAMQAEQERLEARLQRFGNSTDAREIWHALGAEAPDSVPDLDDKAFADLATRIAESADDAR